MTEFTKGPWQWDVGFNGLNGKNDEAVLRWEPYEGMWISTLEGKAYANARLISAAPDLYEALGSIYCWRDITTAPITNCSAKLFLKR